MRKNIHNTVSVVCTAQNDYLKVQAILNEIGGLTHDGKSGPAYRRYSA